MHSHSFARTHLPYCLQRTTDGQWIALNREYTPVGTIGGDPLASYDNHPARMRIDPETIGYLRRITAHLADKGDPRIDWRVYFYMGSPTGDREAWTAYAKVLRALACVTHEVDPQRDAGKPRTLETDEERQARVEREREQDRQPHQVESGAVH